MYFDILKSLGVDHECDRQTDERTDGQTEWPLEIARSNIVWRVLIQRIHQINSNGE